MKRSARACRPSVQNFYHERRHCGLAVEEARSVHSRFADCGQSGPGSDLSPAYPRMVRARKRLYDTGLLRTERGYPRVHAPYYYDERDVSL